MGGLLHDVGRMIIYSYLPQYGRESMIKAFESQSVLQGKEFEVMGFTHQTMGSLLLKHWKFPLTLESMVRYHHDPLRSQHPMDSAIVHIADLMVNALGIGSSGERFTPPLDPAAWELVGLPVSILGPSIKQLDNQLNEIIQFFFADE